MCHHRPCAALRAKYVYDAAANKKVVKPEANPKFLEQVHKRYPDKKAAGRGPDCLPHRRPGAKAGAALGGDACAEGACLSTAPTRPPAPGGHRGRGEMGPRGPKLVIMCSDGRQRSLQVLELLDGEGYVNIVGMKGGFNLWDDVFAPLGASHPAMGPLGR